MGIGWYNKIYDPSPNTKEIFKDLYLLCVFKQK